MKEKVNALTETKTAVCSSKKLESYTIFQPEL